MCHIPNSGSRDNDISRRTSGSEFEMELDFLSRQLVFELDFLSRQLVFELDFLKEMYIGLKNFNLSDFFLEDLGNQILTWMIMLM